MSTVELRQVSKRYGSVSAVDDITLSVESGEFLTLLGPSGCGKTTTLRMIAGFVQPSAGAVTIGGNDVTGTAPHRREVGLVFQNYALFPHMTVGENVGFGLKMRKVDLVERRARVSDALQLVQLAEYDSRYPTQLSGGQQQRVALARALVIKPQVLLLDEPFGALDKQLRDHMRVELRSLQQQLGISTVFVTHDQEEAMAMSDRICVMEAGEIRQLGTPSNIYERPSNRFVADFMGRSNLMEARTVKLDNDTVLLDANGLHLYSAQTELAANADVLVMIRPERIKLTRSDETKVSPVTGEATGEIASAVYLGSLMHYEIDLANEARLQVTEQLDSDFSCQHFDVGDAVKIGIPRESVYVINTD